MFEIQFTTTTGRVRTVTGFPVLGGALTAAAELLSPGMKSLVRAQGFTVKFFGSTPVENPEWPQPYGPQPAVSVEVLDGDALVFDFNAETGDEAARWAKKVLAL